MVTIMRWTGREARALREAQRMSVRAFAAYTKLSTSAIADMETKGEQAQLRHATQQILDEVLATASAAAHQRFCALVGETALHAAPTVTAQSHNPARIVPRPPHRAGATGSGSPLPVTLPGIAAAGPAQPVMIMSGQTGQEMDETNRRQVLVWTLCAAVGVSLREVGDRLAAGSSVVDRQMLAGLCEAAESLASMYRTVDPRPVLPMAAAYADELLDLYDQHADGRGGRQLAQVVVGVHCQVGLWACHTHQPARARRYLATACDLAHGADDPSLHAAAMGALSYLHSSAPHGGTGGHPQRALELLTQALAIAPASDRFTRGWLATWRADQHATMGDLAAARADIQHADTALDAGGDGPARGFFARRHYGYGMRGHLDSVRGLAHTLAGEFDDAAQVFQLVQHQAANGRRRVASFGHQALGFTRASQPEAACQFLGRSVTLAVAEAYPMGLKRALGVRAAFDPAWVDLPCVRELDQQLAPLAAA